MSQKIDTTKDALPVENGVVYIVDDDQAIRDSLTLLLSANGFRVSCHENAERFLYALNSTDINVISCALLDINLGGPSGIELQDALLKMNFHIPVAFITGNGDISSAVDALKKGAVDFLQKPIKEDLLCNLVKTMLSKAYLDNEQRIELENIKIKFKLLTLREAQVLERIVAGRINKQIGTDLDISVKTVEAHRASIMEKLGVRRPANLLQIALKHQEAKARGLI
ncbi:response regulator transcription factor [Polynucleobacter sp.]|jgi:FixJ family two-component response regulator|uniref:response regulator transcription factor n=1 Tax=Polynucleobacter sp. TaxID=2029855 RepID=UPI003F6997B8